MNEIREWVNAEQADWLRNTMELIRIRSVSEPGSHPLHPYGEGCARVLDKALSIASSMGFETENHEYHLCKKHQRGYPH